MQVFALEHIGCSGLFFLPVKRSRASRPHALLAACGVNIRSNCLQEITSCVASKLLPNIADINERLKSYLNLPLL